MTILLFTLVLFGGALIAGLLGSLTGLGGGVVIIPLLTIGLKVDIHYAIGASLMSVIATSSGAASAYVKEGITNLRLGMFLELATTLGAVGGAWLATFLPTSVIAVIFGAILFGSAFMSLFHIPDHIETRPQSRLSRKLKLNGSYPSGEGTTSYAVRNVIGGFFMMNLAGIISGLLGIGSGALKVIAMDSIMHVPFKASSATSNFMIGVTAAASVGIYLRRGYIDPGLSMPIVLGVLIGAFLGSKMLFTAKTGSLKKLFALVVFALALEMIYNGLHHKI
ncbi:MAG: sulfite exporter TauE/SafE family protein [Bacteroidota bacterium]|nr:sulfite exporter TauE/SafE family protein [Bacteroidota bacterium]